jgi:uncharacterized protein YjbI with pentapeptide repeats
MADPDHVKFVELGADAFNQWRARAKEENRERVLDLSEANLDGAQLSGVNLGGIPLGRGRGVRIRQWSPQNPGDFVMMVRQEHDGIDLRKASLRGANLQQAILHHAKLTGSILSRASLRSADLNGANLSDADVSYADLVGVDLSHAILVNANLKNADLSGANLSNADLTDADMANTKFVGANLSGAKLTGAFLRGADFTKSDLRGAAGAIFDGNLLRDVQVSHYAKHPWFILRRSYTGPRFIFLLLFLFAALSPLVVKTIYWAGVGDVERRILSFAVAAVDKAAGALEEAPSLESEGGRDWLEQAKQFQQQVHQFSPGREGVTSGPIRNEDIERAIKLLSDGPSALQSVRSGVLDYNQRLQSAEDSLAQAEQLMRAFHPTGKVKERYVWQLVLGVDSGFFTSVLIVTLLVYNGTRAVLTYKVARLRYEEEQTGFTPGVWRYWWLWWAHRVSSYLLYVSIASGLYQLWIVLFTPVLVPD